jgi:hypothetical protein
VLPDISAHHREYYLANSAKEFCPTYKPVSEWQSDGIYQLVFVVDKMLVPTVKTV